MKKGYYQQGDFYFPRVSSITKQFGDSFGLTHWAAKQGAVSVMMALQPRLRELVEITDVEALKGNLDAFMGQLASAAAIGTAEDKGVAGYRAELKRTQEYGSLLHDYFDCVLTDKMLPEIVDDTAKQAVETFSEFVDVLKPCVIKTETDLIYAPETPTYEDVCFGGRFDLAIDANESVVTTIKPTLKKGSNVPTQGVWLVDYKTGSFYKDTHILQLGAYKQAWELRFPDQPISGALVIHLPRETPDELTTWFITPEEMDEYFNTAFKGIFAAWRVMAAPKWYKKQFEKGE